MKSQDATKKKPLNLSVFGFYLILFHSFPLVFFRFLRFILGSLFRFFVRFGFVFCGFYNPFKAPKYKRFLGFEEKKGKRAER